MQTLTLLWWPLGQPTLLAQINANNDGQTDNFTNAAILKRFQFSSQRFFLIEPKRNLRNYSADKKINEVLHMFIC